MLFKFVFWLSWLIILVIPIQGSTAGSSQNANPQMKYVKASPPSITLLCSDGIFCVAIHIPDGSLDSNIGPKRVEQIDTGALLLTSGWRTDGMQLVDKARELVLDDVATFGTISLTSNLQKRDLDYGKRLANRLVDYIVDCHVQDSVRSLATVGMLATLSSVDSGIFDNRVDINICGALHFIDVTGVYPCRGLAIGMHSDEINQQLMKHDFESWSVDEAKNKIMDLLRFNNNKSSSKDQQHNNIDDAKSTWKIPENAILEIVIMRAPDGTIHRTSMPYISTH